MNRRQHGFTLIELIVTTAILAILVGGLGIHNFYAGRNGSGTVQLLISVLLCWTVIAAL